MMNLLQVEMFKVPHRWRMGRRPKPHQQAIIDIGSNSVRLIVYQITGRSIVPRINEKVMAGLGRGVSETGCLSPEGVVAARSALIRYRDICASLGVTDIVAIATAAVRDAKDGSEFCEAIEAQTGIAIRILSGGEEAHYAAMGVVAAQSTPTGLIGDLGGSSLELIAADEGVLSTGQTYPVGPLALQGIAAEDLESEVRKRLRASGRLPRTEKFYAVGGAWRAFAKLYMHVTDYPLEVLQSFTIPASEAIALCAQLIDKKSKIHGSAKSITGRRYATLGSAAVVLKAVLEETKAERLVISAYGLREGLVFSGMVREMQKLDPLLAGLTTLVRPDTGQAAFSNALMEFLSDAFRGLEGVFEEESNEARLLIASCLLADIGGLLHPDHRADIARQLVLRGPYTGISHPGRIFLGLVTGYRYNRKFNLTGLERKVLTPAQIERAKTIALLIRVAAEFSGRTERILRRAKLRIEGDTIRLELRKQHKQLVSESVIRRFEQAAKHMKLTPVIE